jgi:hypothetical protein
MNPDTLIYFTLAERKLVEQVIAQEEVNTLEDLKILAEACCDLYNAVFVGEVGEA